MDHIPWDRIDKEIIDRLVADEIPESKTLEYKQSLPLTHDKGRDEFLADFTSFANAAGGQIVYGVKTKKVEGRNTLIPEEVVGLPGVNADEAIGRLESWLQALVQPRVVGHQIKPVQGPSQNAPVIVIRIPRSWSAPHMLVGSPRFHSRDNAGKHPMDVGEIRSAIVSSDEVPQRIRRFREGRLARIIAGETPVPMASGQPMVVLHMFPIVSLDPGTSIDVASLRYDSVNTAPFNSHMVNIRHRLNIDGCLKYRYPTSSNTSESWGYVQFFRNGSIETVDAWTVGSIMKRRPTADATAPVFSALAVERETIDAVHRYRTMLAGLQVAPPICVMLSLLGVHGFGIAEEFPGREPSCESFDRSDIILPDVLINDREDRIDEVLRPAFDAMWQAAGEDRSLNYNGDGQWVSDTRC